MQVRLSGANLLFDPGNFSAGFEGLTGLDAILVTHQHPDHLDPTKIAALVAANPNAVLYADPQTVALLADRTDVGSWSALGPGEQVEVRGSDGSGEAGAVTIRATGGRHAVIHPAIPVIDNTAYIVDGPDRKAAFMHPGDSFYIPFERIDVLALPAAAPWMKLSESVDYLRGVAPRQAFPIHQGVLSDVGRAVHNGRLAEMAPDGTEFAVLEPGTTREF